MQVPKFTTLPPGESGNDRPAATSDLPDPKTVLERIAAPAGNALPLPRLLIVFAHPDDEVLAMGARLERLTDSRLLTVTDGAPVDGADALDHGFLSLEAYRAARKEELAAALAQAGVSLEAITPGMDLPPVPVPDQTAALHLSALARVVAEAIQRFAPEAVLTHPYEGGHPDHDACAFAVHTAVRWLQERDNAGLQTQKSAQRMPLVIETPSYHSGGNGAMRTGLFLKDEYSSESIRCDLSSEEQANKHARLASFRSQAETLAQFGTERETFRVAPRYNFTQAPHEGRLFYEQFSWGMTGERFCMLAAQAINDLFAPIRPQSEKPGEPVESSVMAP